MRRLLPPKVTRKVTGAKLKALGKSPTEEHLGVTPEKADAKRRETQRAHDEFIRRLEGYLTNDHR